MTHIHVVGAVDDVHGLESAEFLHGGKVTLAAVIMYHGRGSAGFPSATTAATLAASGWVNGKVVSVIIYLPLDL